MLDQILDWEHMNAKRDVWCDSHLPKLLMPPYYWTLISVEAERDREISNSSVNSSQNRDGNFYF